MKTVKAKLRGGGQKEHGYTVVSIVTHQHLLMAKSWFTIKVTKTITILSEWKIKLYHLAKIETC